LTLDGTETGNYSLTQPTTTADITAKELSVTGITADNKVYNGTTAAAIHTGSAVLNGVVDTEDVTVNTSGAAGAFANKHVCTGKTVHIPWLTLDGTQTGNYSLTQPATTADIGAKTVVGHFTASNKDYDGTTDATISGRSLTGVISGDTVSL